jgi:hypothetical protein
LHPANTRELVLDRDAFAQFRALAASRFLQHCERLMAGPGLLANSLRDPSLERIHLTRQPFERGRRGSAV